MAFLILAIDSGNISRASFSQFVRHSPVYSVVSWSSKGCT